MKFKVTTKCRFRRSPFDVMADPNKETTMLSRIRTQFPAFASLLAGLVVLAATEAHAQANPWGGPAANGNYAEVNGIKLYYEIHGTGRPLVLLHGGLGAIPMFGANLP